MKHGCCAWLLALMVSPVLADVAVFVTPPDASAPILTVDDVAVVAEYPVKPNIMELAKNLVLKTPLPLVFDVPGQSATVVNVRRFTPLEGFEATEEGELRIPPGTVDAELSFNVYGVAYGKELSLVVHRGRMTGSLTGMFPRLGQAWTIVESKNQRVLRDLDTSKYPPEPDDRPIELPKQRPALADGKHAIDRGGTVSIVVLHTANAVAQAGGLGPMEELIRASFVDLEHALINSQAIRVRIDRVLIDSPDGLHESAPVGYNESPGIASDQQRWYAHRRWARTDPQAIAIRNQHNADLIVMMVGDTGTCGVAYTQRPNCGVASGEANLCNVGQGYVNFAVSVVSTRPMCGLPTLTLAHEVGHQFGMEHDPPNGAGVAAASFPWSYGYTISTFAVQARTIMAYEYTSGPLINCPNGCPVQRQFSNPNVDFLSFPGVPSGTLVGDVQGRHSVNARTAAFYAPTMETFRGPVLPDFGVFGHGFEALPDIVCDPVLWPNCPP